MWGWGGGDSPAMASILLASVARWWRAAIQSTPPATPSRRGTCSRSSLTPVDRTRTEIQLEIQGRKKQNKETSVTGAPQHRLYTNLQVRMVQNEICADLVFPIITHNSTPYLPALCWWGCGGGWGWSPRPARTSDWSRGAPGTSRSRSPGPPAAAQQVPTEGTNSYNSSDFS